MKSLATRQCHDENCKICFPDKENRMTDKEMLERSVEYARKAAEDKMKDAIATMRKFIDNVERESQRDSFPVHDRISQIMQQFAWGMANASNDLGNAIGYATQMTIAATQLTKEEK